MRIVHVTPTYFSDSSVIGGGERSALNAAKALALHPRVARSDVLSLGHERRQVVLGPKSALQVVAARPAASAFEARSIAETDFRRHLADYDIVHVHQCLTSFGLFVAAHARLLGRRVVGTDHGGGETPLLRAHPFMYRAFDFLVALSDFAASFYVDAPVPVRTIRGAVDDSVFAYSPAERRDPTLVVAIGRLLPHKGFETLIDALPPDLKLVIVGRNYDQKYAAYLYARARRKNVEFASSMEDDSLRDLISRAGLCAHPSVRVDYRGGLHPKAELLGLAPLECMLTGIPAICSRTAALGELDQLQGCRTYETGQDLGELLCDYAAGRLNFPSGHEIRAEVSAGYGLEQYGRRYVAALDGDACASC